jgi:purine-binding chemotaxis protein CheW
MPAAVSEARAPSNDVISVVVFTLDGQRYALALSSVSRVLPMVAIAPLPGGPPMLLGVIDLHGQPLPVVDLRARWGCRPAEAGVDARLVVARTTRRQIALPVDQVLEIAHLDRQAIASSTDVLPGGIGRVRGVAATADGLLFVHDIEAVLSADEDAQLGSALKETAI